MKIKQIYEEKYKLLLLIPFIILVLSLLQIGIQYSLTGDFVNKGVSLKGGSTITITKMGSFDAQELENSLDEMFPKADISLREITAAGKIIAIAVDSDAQEKEEIDALTAAVVKNAGLSSEDYSVEVMGSSLGESFFRQTF